MSKLQQNIKKIRIRYLISKTDKKSDCHKVSLIRVGFFWERVVEMKTTTAPGPSKSIVAFGYIYYLITQFNMWVNPRYRIICKFYSQEFWGYLVKNGY